MYRLTIDVVVTEHYWARQRRRSWKEPPSGLGTHPELGTRHHQWQFASSERCSGNEARLFAVVRASVSRGDRICALGVQRAKKAK